jgi:hypothetical protein
MPIFHHEGAKERSYTKKKFWALRARFGALHSAISTNGSFVNLRDPSWLCGEKTALTPLSH